MDNYNTLNHLLKPSNSVNWSDNSIPIHERGIRGDWLLKVLNSVRDLRVEICERHDSQSRAALHFDHVPEPDFPRLDGTLTSNVFVRDHVIPWTADIEAPLFALVPDEYTGKPTQFLSYTWNSGYFDSGYGVIYAIEKHLKSHYIWMDVMCHNQHAIGSVTKQMHDVIAGINQLLLPMSQYPWYDRVWCIWEVICALKNDKEIIFCEYLKKDRDFRKIFTHFLENFKSIAHAETLHKEDKDEILSNVIHMFGSIDAADKYLYDIMKNKLSQKF